MQIQRILVPVDYSACSRASLDYAVELAEKLGAEVDIVHVWDRPSYVSDALLSRSELVPGKSLIALIQSNAERDLSQFLAEARIPSARVGRLLKGDPTAALLHELELGRHQLVVVGTHGRTGLSHALLGSVAEKLVRLSPVPVITVPNDHAREQRQRPRSVSASS